MNIWIFNHYAEGPEGAVTRPFDISQHAVQRGHHVTIFASSFNHYSFHETRLSGLQLWRHEQIDGVNFLWLRTFPYRWNDWRRVLNWFTYVLVALALGIMRRPRPDAVVGVSVHPLAALAGSLVAAARRAQFYFEVTDLWPQTLIDFGRISPNGRTARALRAIERHLYRRSRRIFMLWRNTHEYVASLGCDPQKIVWFPHGVLLERYADLPAYDGKARNPFTVMYLGGFVDNNDIGTLVDAAAELQQRQRDNVRLALVGSGTNKENWIKRVQEREIRNVDFPNPVPKSELASVMRDADAFIYAVRDLPLYRYGISMNKLVDYLASGRPILFAGNSGYDPVAEAQAGYSVPPEDPSSLANAIERLVALDPAERQRMGENGRRQLMENHLISVLGDRFLAVLAIPSNHDEPSAGLSTLLRG
jgi:glycosyltransferase involved in cell wall biosynthesis